jgi:hypothetical protein
MIQDVGFRIQGLKFRGQSSGFRVLGFRGKKLGFGV